MKKILQVFAFPYCTIFYCRNKNAFIKNYFTLLNTLKCTSNYISNNILLCGVHSPQKIYKIACRVFKIQTKTNGAAHWLPLVHTTRETKT